MIKTPFISLALRASLVASAFLYSTGSASAINVDPFTFCTNTCKSPGPCDQETIQKDCKIRCKDDSIWKHVASLQMSNSSKEFRMEKNKAKKDSLLNQSPIAKCLALAVKEPSRVDPLAPPPYQTATAPTSSANVTATKNDLCAAAIQAEIKALEQNKTALQGQKENLEAHLKQLETMK
jgi:hypothetical protein